MAGSRFEVGAIPLHHQVYLHLKAKLDDGTYPPGDRLPPERELARQFGLSLITVRRALDELAREQRIKRTQGRGTHVLHERIERNLGGSLRFTDEMHARGLLPQTRLLGGREEPAGEAVATALGIALGDPILYLERLRLASGEPLLLEQVRLPAERFPGLLEADLEHQSLYDLMGTQYGAPVSFVREALEPVLLRAREARLLNQPRRSPALLVEGTAFTAAGLPVEFSRTYVRGDRTRYYVERVVVRSRGAATERQSTPAAGRQLQ